MFQFRMANCEEYNRELNVFQLKMDNSEECYSELNMFQFKMAETLKKAIGIFTCFNSEWPNLKNAIWS